MTQVDFGHPVQNTILHNRVMARLGPNMKPKMNSTYEVRTYDRQRSHI